MCDSPNMVQGGRVFAGQTMRVATECLRVNVYISVHTRVPSILQEQTSISEH